MTRKRKRIPVPAPVSGPCRAAGPRWVRGRQQTRASSPGRRLPRPSPGPWLHRRAVSFSVCRLPHVPDSAPTPVIPFWVYRDPRDSSRSTELLSVRHILSVPGSSVPHNRITHTRILSARTPQIRMQFIRSQLQNPLYPLRSWHSGPPLILPSAVGSPQLLCLWGLGSQIP